jgi:outer membrane protein assembly factor BamB
MKIPNLLVRVVQINVFLIVSLSALLTGCGGGGGGGGGGASPPMIQGLVLSFPAGAAPANLPNSWAIVSVMDGSSGANITDASVTVNGVALTYNSAPSNQEFEGTVPITPGATVTLVVSVGSRTYTASGTQATTYPTISAPASGATWTVSSMNTVAWSGGTPLANAAYLLGVLDATDPIGSSAYFQAFAASNNSFPIPANTLTPGSRDVIVGITTIQPVPNARTSSGLIIGGFNYVPVTVTSVSNPPPYPALLSIAVTPGNPSIVNGTTVQLAAKGTYSDYSTQDLTNMVIWSSSDNTKATVSTTGLVTSVAVGPTTLTATSGTIAGSTQANVFQPSTPSADWVTFQGDAGHSGFVNAQFDPTLFTQIWTWTAPPNTGGNPVHINSVATGAGKVFVTKDIYFDQAALYALNETDGTENWTYAFGTMASEGPPAVGNGDVFVPTTDPGERCVTWAIDATLGTYQFKMPSSCQWSAYFAPTALGGSVLQSSQGGTIYSYSIFSGGLQWSAPTGAYDQTTPAADAQYAYQYGIGSPALNVFDRMTGAMVASIADPFAPAYSGYSMFSAPMLGATGDAIVYSGGGFSGLGWGSSEQGGSRPLVSYNVAGKAIAWRTANAYLTHPAIANGVIYAARNAPATLDALSEADGHILWSWTPPVGNTSFHRNTVVTNNLVFVSTDANVYAIDLSTHQAVWQYPKPGMLAISGSSILYIATGATLSDGNLVAIKLK